jgi:hypothetical protein
MVRPKGLTPGRRIRVESSVTDEPEVRQATRVTVLEPAATTVCLVCCLRTATQKRQGALSRLPCLSCAREPITINRKPRFFAGGDCWSFGRNKKGQQRRWPRNSTNINVAVRTYFILSASIIFTDSTWTSFLSALTLALTVTWWPS